MKTNDFKLRGKSGVRIEQKWREIFNVTINLIQTYVRT